MDVHTLRRTHAQLHARVDYAETRARAAAAAHVAETRRAGRVQAKLRESLGQGAVTVQQVQDQLVGLIHGARDSVARARRERDAAQRDARDSEQRLAQAMGQSAELARELARETAARVAAETALADLRQDKYAGDAAAAVLMSQVAALDAANKASTSACDRANRERLKSLRERDAAVRDTAAVQEQLDAARAEVAAAAAALDDQRGVVEAMKDELSLAQSQVAPLRERVADADARIVELEHSVASLSSALEDATSAVQREQTRARGLEGDLNASSSSIQTLQARLDALARNKAQDARARVLESVRESLAPAAADVASALLTAAAAVDHARFEAAHPLEAAQVRINELLAAQKALTAGLAAAKTAAAASEERIARLRAQLRFAQEEARAARPLSNVPPPKGNVTLMFTDVKSSTKQWAANPTVMAAALSLHNALIRDILDEYGAYECKTEGDAFMVAFASPQQAVATALAIQASLLDVDWPPELLLNDASRKETALDPDAGVDVVIYRGLRVRIGIHTGEPMAALDPVTKRMDYFGPMVNLSARVESAATGGQTLISDAVFDALPDSVLSTLTVHDLGQAELKGIPVPVNLYSVATGVLALRSFDPLPPPDQQPDPLNASASSTNTTPSTLGLDDTSPELRKSLISQGMNMAFQLLGGGSSLGNLDAASLGNLDAASLEALEASTGELAATLDPSPMFATMAMDVHDATTAQASISVVLNQVAEQLAASGVDADNLLATVNETAAFTTAASSPAVSLPKDIDIDGMDPKSLTVLQRQHLWIRNRAEELEHWLDQLHDVLDDFVDAQADRELAAELRTKLRAAHAKIAQQASTIRTLKAAFTAASSAAPADPARTRPRSDSQIVRVANTRANVNRVKKAWLARLRAKRVGDPPSPGSKESAEQKWRP